MASHRPWDFIDFPQSTSDTKIYVPVSYGVFTPNSNSYYDTTVTTHDLSNSIFDSDSVNTLDRPFLIIRLTRTDSSCVMRVLRLTQEPSSGTNQQMLSSRLMMKIILQLQQVF